MTTIPNSGTLSSEQSPEMLMGELRGVLARIGKLGSGGVDSEGQPYFKASCPSHPDRQPSLSVTAGRKRVRLHCFAGCDEDTILAELGRDRQSLFYERARRPDGANSSRPTSAAAASGKGSRTVGGEVPAAEKRSARSYRTFAFPGLGGPSVVHEYRRLDGELAYCVARYPQTGGDKTFRQFAPDPSAPGSWFRRGPRDQDKVLYGLPELREAIGRGDLVVFVEGEKDADKGNAAELGCRFTTAAGGAKAAWQPQYTDHLAGASFVVVVADVDQPDKQGRRAGLEYAARVAGELRRAGIPHAVVQAASGKDWTDHAEAGGGLDDLVPVELDTDSEGTPPRGPRPPDPQRDRPHQTEPAPAHPREKNFNSTIAPTIAISYNSSISYNRSIRLGEIHQKENDMSTITRTGNLASVPELRHDEKGRAYTFARIIVTDRVRGENGEWEDGGTIGYDVAVSGSEAENLVATAEASGNIRVLFTGDYRTRLYTPEAGEQRIVHEVRGASVAVSLRGQTVTVEKRGSEATGDSDQPS